MKKFRFGLERVLRVRNIQQLLRLAEQKRAEKAFGAQQQRLAMFTGERDIQSEAMVDSLSRPNRIADRMTDWRYLQRIERIVGFQSSVVREHDHHMSEARRRFLLARRDRLGLEKLGERKREAWFKEILREEQSFSDDISQSRPKNK
ncbi:flagellar FliJ family protein [bacterium]|nr:flagellar FliJ family protein [bacterium]